MAKKIAKCYYVTGWWRYYRTADGETFCIRDGKYYFHFGNAFTGKKTESKFIDGDELKKIKAEYEFVE